MFNANTRMIPRASHERLENIIVSWMTAKAIIQFKHFWSVQRIPMSLSCYFIKHKDSLPFLEDGLTN